MARKARFVCRKLRFRAPGDDWYTGKAVRYRVQWASGGNATSGVGPQTITNTKPAGALVSVRPFWGRVARVWAVDEAGNSGRTELLRLQGRQCQ